MPILLDVQGTTTCFHPLQASYSTTDSRNNVQPTDPVYTYIYGVCRNICKLPCGYRYITRMRLLSLSLSLQMRASSPVLIPFLWHLPLLGASALKTVTSYH